jgi:hypothetical protein
MPGSVSHDDDRSEQGRVMAAVADLAGPGFAERMRLDAATRVLVTARRLMRVAPGAAASGSASAAVLCVAHAWDPAATTAAEHVESLPPVQLDAFLAAAPAWATSVRNRTQDETRRAA